MKLYVHYTVSKYNFYFPVVILAITLLFMILFQNFYKTLYSKIRTVLQTHGMITTACYIFSHMLNPYPLRIVNTHLIPL